MKESIILYDIERELVASQFHNAAVMCAALGTAKSAEVSKEFMESALRVETPWSVSGESNKTKEQKLIELYHNLIKNKDSKDGNPAVVVI
jgi:hypothetical protein